MLHPKNVQFNNSLLRFWLQHIQRKTVETLTDFQPGRVCFFFVSACKVSCFCPSDLTTSHTAETGAAKVESLFWPRFGSDAIKSLDLKGLCRFRAQTLIHDISPTHHHPTLCSSKRWWSGAGVTLAQAEHFQPAGSCCCMCTVSSSVEAGGQRVVGAVLGSDRTNPTDG